MKTVTMAVKNVEPITSNRIFRSIPDIGFSVSILCMFAAVFVGMRVASTVWHIGIVNDYGVVGWIEYLLLIIVMRVVLCDTASMK